eukprot:4947067-Pleurochrysis_carterae.AAC.1
MVFPAAAVGDVRSFPICKKVGRGRRAHEKSLMHVVRVTKSHVVGLLALVVWSGEHALYVSLRIVCIVREEFLC